MPDIEFIEDAIEERVDPETSKRYDIRYKKGQIRGNVSEGTADFWISRNKARRLIPGARQAVGPAVVPVEKPDASKAAIAAPVPVVDFATTKTVFEPPSPPPPTEAGDTKRGPGRPKNPLV